MGVFLFMGSGEIALANLKIHLVHQSLLGEGDCFALHEIVCGSDILA